MIPKIIHQLWIGEKLAPINLMNTWKEKHPDYEYIYWNEEELKKRNFISCLQNKIDEMDEINGKADILRWEILYHYGGIYLDLDMDGLKNMEEILLHNAVFPIDEYINSFNGRFQRYKKFYNNEQYFLLGQYAFAAEPKNPFIKSLIDNIHNNINKIIKTVNHNHEDYVYTTTGPDYVSKIYLEYKDKENIHILDNKKRQYFGDFAQHKYFGSWKKS